jgi:hypothetical protein
MFTAFCRCFFLRGLEKGAGARKHQPSLNHYRTENLPAANWKAVTPPKGRISKFSLALWPRFFRLTRKAGAAPRQNVPHPRQVAGKVGGRFSIPSCVSRRHTTESPSVCAVRYPSFSPSARKSITSSSSESECEIFSADKSLMFVTLHCPG